MTSTARTERDRAVDALRGAGLRATDQRVEVLVTLDALSGDTSAQALHEQMQANGHTLGLATVYRTLTALVDAGLVDALQHGHGTCYRKCAPGHHHHLTCVRCHEVIELHDCGVDGWATAVAAQHGYADVRHVVELSGTCAACNAQ